MKAKKKSNLPLKEAIKVATQHGREFDKRYISRVPRKPLSVGYVLVHNHIAHTKDMPVGLNGFRIWTQKAEPEHLELCKCGWEGVVHYHFKGGSRKSSGSLAMFAAIRPSIGIPAIWPVIGIRRRNTNTPTVRAVKRPQCGSNADVATSVVMMDRARFCDGRSFRSSGCTRGLFIHTRSNLTTWNGAWW